MNKVTSRMSTIAVATLVVQLMSPLSSSATTLKHRISGQVPAAPIYVQIIMHQEATEKTRMFNDKGPFDLLRRWTLRNRHMPPRTERDLIRPVLICMRDKC